MLQTYLRGELETHKRLWEDIERCHADAGARRWPGGAMCPYCQARETWYSQPRRVFGCTRCRRQFTVRVGTVCEDSRLGLDRWMFAYLFVQFGFVLGRVTATLLAEQTGVTIKTAARILTRLHTAKPGDPLFPRRVLSPLLALAGLNIPPSVDPGFEAFREGVKKHPPDATTRGRWERTLSQFDENQLAEICGMHRLSYWHLEAVQSAPHADKMELLRMADAQGMTASALCLYVTRRRQDARERARSSRGAVGLPIGERVYRWLFTQGPEGATDNELLFAFPDMGGSALRTSRAELVDEGRVRKVGERQPTPSQRAHAVWAAAQLGEARTHPGRCKP